MRGIIQYVRRGLLTAINQSPIYKFVSDNLIDDSGLIDPTNNWVATGDFSFVAGQGAFYYADSNEGMIRPEDQFFQNWIIFSLFIGILKPGSIKIERGMKKYFRGLIMRFFGLMGSSLVPGEGQLRTIAPAR